MKLFVSLLTLLTIMLNAQPSIRYSLSMPKPHTHLIDVEIRVDGHKAKTLELHMAAWRTGRYVLLDFSGGVQQFSARDEKDNILPVKKTDKDTWRIEKGNAKSVSVQYKVYANEFNMRTRELNSEHAFIDPLAVFMYADELKNLPLELTVVPYSDWKVTTGLEDAAGKPNTFTAPNFEYFGDCPLEIGHQKDFEFFVDSKKHIISIYGDGSWNSDTLITDFTKIIIANKELWGELPYSKYIFMIHCQPNAGGGTEHINSTIMGVRPFTFTNPGAYKGFLGLVSHEYFHTWNVKQLRPKAIAPYDFSKEGYTEELWVSEGTTSYYDDLIMLRAKFSDDASYLKNISLMVTHERSRIGNTIQPLAESSFDAWVKYWRQRQNSQNAESDYYGKGSHVSLLLDLEIRQRSKNAHSLDDVMKAMFQRFPLTKGFTNADLQKVCEEFGGGSFKEFFQTYLYTTAPLPWEQSLSYAGLTVTKRDTVSIGAVIQDAGDRPRITNIVPGSPAENAALEINDEIVAVNGYRARSAEINERIAAMQIGEEMTFHIYRNDKLKEITLKLENFLKSMYTVKKMTNPSDLQRSIYEGWLQEKFDKK